MTDGWYSGSLWLLVLMVVLALSAAYWYLTQPPSESLGPDPGRVRPMDPKPYTLDAADVTQGRASHAPDTKMQI